MTASFRTERGGRIDRSRTIGFSFDGQKLAGHPGDTLASALLANGIHLMGRSFKYHRPRGVLGAGAEEPNALVGVDRGGGRYTPNLRATQVELYEGLQAQSQNRWPSLAFDVGEVNDLVPGVIGAGFYYKTFMAPASAWKSVYEPVIRRAAGLGVAPKEADPDHYTHRYAFCDVLVVGAGAAGLAAATAAAESGATVMLVDEQNEPGGGLLAEREATIDGVPAAEWAARSIAALRARETVTILTRTQAFGYYAQNFVGLAERLTDHLASPDPRAPRERMWKVRAKQVVLATGAIERPLVFPDNDRPGIMLASAARIFANRYGVRPGARAVVFTADDSGYGAALDLAAAGVTIAAIVDLRDDPQGPAVDAARRAGLSLRPASVIAGTTGRLRVTGAMLGTRTAEGAVRAGETIACDVLAMSGGWTPSVHLFSQSRGKLRFDEARQIYVPGNPVQAQYSAGSCNGTFGIASALAEGYAAGEAAADAGRSPEREPRGSHFPSATAGEPEGSRSGGMARADGTERELPGSHFSPATPGEPEGSRSGGMAHADGTEREPPGSHFSPATAGEPEGSRSGGMARADGTEREPPGSHFSLATAGEPEGSRSGGMARADGTEREPPGLHFAPATPGEPERSRSVGLAAAPSVSGEILPAGGLHGAVPHHRDPARVKAFVDFQNDVTAKDIKLAVREGFRSIEHVKRYTTNGMATDQGKTSNMNGLAIASAALARPIPEVGLTTFRAPYTPVTFGAFAGHSRGDLFDPIRRTATHAWAQAQGAVFEDVGMWKRAWYFPRAGEDMHTAVNRECKTVRSSVGLFDASTLGKIEVVGPDAAEFMNRLYTNPWTKLEPGRCRYGLMLNEAGFVMDDGVIGRLAVDRFHVTTTTGGAPRVLAHMEDYLQTEFTDLKVWLTSTTEQWAVIAVQGPHARTVLEPLVEGIDLSAAAMPHMSVREGHVGGVPCRLFRVSFTGELGFELNVPADYGQSVWEAVWAEGQKHGMVAYGTETMHALRAEKGFIIVGQETDGTVTPSDLGLDWAIGKAKPDFVGKRALARPDLQKTDRKQLVGLLTADPTTVLEEGAQVTVEAAPVKGTPALGHVTSSYWSEALGRSIALAVVSAGRSRMGTTLHVPMPDGAVAVQVVEPIFYDKDGSRLDG